MSQEEKEENDKKLILLGYEWCDGCKRLHKHLEKSKDGEKNLCGNCKRREVTNKWFTPLTSRNNSIGTFSMSNLEIGVRIRQLICSGLPPEQARQRVFGNLKYMRQMKKSKRRNYWKELINKKTNEQESKVNLKRFLEGLK